jgi:hypothetical protein
LYGRQRHLQLAGDRAVRKIPPRASSPRPRPDRSRQRAHRQTPANPRIGVCRPSRDAASKPGRHRLKSPNPKGKANFHERFGRCSFSQKPA